MIVLRSVVVDSSVRDDRTLLSYLSHCGFDLFQILLKGLSVGMLITQQGLNIAKLS